jgi:hypothetical protein
MRCKKCNFISFDYLSTCKCGADLADIRQELGLLDVEPAIPFRVDIIMRGESTKDVGVDLEGATPEPQIRLDKEGPMEELPVEDLQDFIEEEVSVDLSTGRLEDFLKEPGLKEGLALGAGVGAAAAATAAMVPTEDSEVPVPLDEDAIELLDEDMDDFMADEPPSEELISQEPPSIDSDVPMETLPEDETQADLDLDLAMSEDLSDLLKEDIGSEEDSELATHLDLETDASLEEPVLEKGVAAEAVDMEKGDEETLDLDLDTDLSDLLEGIGSEEDSELATHLDLEADASMEEPVPEKGVAAEKVDMEKGDEETLDLGTDLSDLLEKMGSEEDSEAIAQIDTEPEISFEKAALEQESAEVARTVSEDELDLDLDLDSDLSEDSSEVMLDIESEEVTETSEFIASSDVSLQKVALEQKGAEVATTVDEDELDLDLDLDADLDVSPQKAAPEQESAEATSIMNGDELGLVLDEDLLEDSSDLMLDLELEDDSESITEVAPASIIPEKEPPKKEKGEEAPIQISPEDSEELVSKFEEDLSNFIADMEFEDAYEETQTKFVSEGEVQEKDLKLQETDLEDIEEDPASTSDLDLDDLIKELEKSSSVE